MNKMQLALSKQADQVRVWDPFIRVFHWTLVVAITVSFITEGKPRWLHVGSGYLIGTLVILRVIWGFAGPRYARFSDFVRGPREVFGHLLDVVRFRSKRFMGHDPAGGAMIVALLLSLSLTVASGLMLYAAEDHAGPLAGWVAMAPSSLPLGPQEALAKGGDHDEYGEYGGAKASEKAEEFFEEIHEALVGLTMGLVIAHICGVLLVSLQTRENLVFGMITGRKRRLEN